MIKIYEELEQGTPEWLQARCGVLTASEVKNIMTAKSLKLSVKKNPNEELSHLWELLAQRITQFVEPTYVSDDMERGCFDEVRAREVYSEKFAPVDEVGFITNDEWGFTLGFSPDGLVGNDGCIEIKSRKQKFQVETIITNAEPSEHVLQMQTGMLVSGRKWCDYISFSEGMPMMRCRVHADDDIQGAIITAATEFEKRLNIRLEQYNETLIANERNLIPTERIEIDAD